MERHPDPDHATEEFWRGLPHARRRDGAQGPRRLPSPAARAPLHVVRSAVRRARGTGHAGHRQAPVGQEPDDVHVVLRLHGEAPRRRRDRVQLPVRRRARVDGHRRTHVRGRVPKPARPLLRARDAHSSSTTTAASTSSSATSSWRCTSRCSVACATRSAPSRRRRRCSRRPGTAARRSVAAAGRRRAHRPGVGRRGR